VTDKLMSLSAPVGLVCFLVSVRTRPCHGQSNLLRAFPHCQQILPDCFDLDTLHFTCLPTGGRASLWHPQPQQQEQEPEWVQEVTAPHVWAIHGAAGNTGGAEMSAGGKATQSFIVCGCPLH
jgi:hypothetical protein